MKIIKILSAVAVLLAGATAMASDDSAAVEKPSFYAQQSETVTATVEAINAETRDVTLRLADGEIVSFTASEEARNLDQVSIGDLVTAQYIERMTVRVVANDGQEPTAAGLSAMARTEKGEMPGVAASDTVVVTYTVEDINIEANTFKLKGPDGMVEEFTAMNPDNLKRAAVGDLVIMTMTMAVAISVEPSVAE